MKWADATYSKEVELLRAVEPGSWAQTKLTLPKVPPLELSYVRIGVSPDKLSLKTIR